MKTKSLSWILVVPALALGVVGCGSHPTPSASKHHHHAGKSKGSTVPSSGPSASQNPSSTSTPSGSVPVATVSNPAPVLTAAPPAGGVAGANQVQASVNSVQAEGNVQVNGQTEHLYLINVTLKNPTTAMILFSLSDLIVGPSQAEPVSSLNDFNLTGVSQQNSLFPYPIVPQHASAVTANVPSGQSVSGSFTVEVPLASHYSIWISEESGAIATFSA